MDEFSPCTSATHEMIQRIDVLKARIAGYDCDAIKEANAALAFAKARLIADQTRLAEWLHIATRSA